MAKDVGRPHWSPPTLLPAHPSAVLAHRFDGTFALLITSSVGLRFMCAVALPIVLSCAVLIVLESVVPTARR